MTYQEDRNAPSESFAFFSAAGSLDDTPTPTPAAAPKAPVYESAPRAPVYAPNPAPRAPVYEPKPTYKLAYTDYAPKGTAGMILGIISFVLTFIPIPLKAWIVLILSLIGLSSSSKARNAAKSVGRTDGAATAGTILSSVALAWAIICFAIALLSVLAIVLVVVLGVILGGGGIAAIFGSFAML